MIDEEALVLITKAALIDPRMKRTDDVERADMAEAWAEVLHDVALVDALEALRALQRRRGAAEPAIQPADILSELDVVDQRAALVDVDHDPAWLAETKRTALAEFGYTPEQYDADPAVRADVVARWSTREIEASDA